MFERLFSSKVTLCWRGRVGKLNPYWYPDRLADRELLRRFMADAGLEHRNGVRVRAADIDAVIAAAGAHGYSVEIIG
jgi:hypothetical protein